MKKEEATETMDDSQFIKKTRTGKQFDLKKIFANVGVFEKIARHKGLAELAAGSRLIEMDEQKYIVKEGVASEGGFIVLSGKIEISHKSISGDDNIVIAVVNVEEANIKSKKQLYPFIGEQAFVSHGERGATVLTLSKTYLLEISYSVFNKVVNEYPEIGMHVYREICKITLARLETANKNVVALFGAYLDRLQAEDLMDDELNL